MAIFLPSLKKSGHLDKIHITVCIVGSRKIAGKDDYASQGWNIFAPNLSIYGFDADTEACDEANAVLRREKLLGMKNTFLSLLEIKQEYLQSILLNTLDVVRYIRPVSLILRDFRETQN